MDVSWPAFSSSIEISYCLLLRFCWVEIILFGQRHYFTGGHSNVTNSLRYLTAVSHDTHNIFRGVNLVRTQKSPLFFYICMQLSFDMELSHMQNN